ncbi:MAG: hypothetical protein KGL35_08765 [Bradyrhizobium sp.]|nr:hypothetical protein [Bradyrhizobium sp.]
MKIEPGCLAVIVCSTVPENINRVVTVKEFDLQLSELLGRRYWLVECPTPLRCSIGGYKTVGYAPESCLRPISGPEIARHVQLWDELPLKVKA